MNSSHYYIFAMETFLIILLFTYTRVLLKLCVTIMNLIKIFNKVSYDSIKQ